MDPEEVSAMEPLALALQEHNRLGKSVGIDFRRDDGIWYTQSTDQYFSVPDWLIEIEAELLGQAAAPVLDVGAASGRQALALQKRGLTVTALDTSARAVELMTQRGVVDARVGDIFELDHGQWHSVLFLMETIGLAGTITRLHDLLERLQPRVSTEGQILLDARPIQTTGGGANYPGELELQMRFRNKIGDVFRWLYLDFDTLREVAGASGWTVERLTVDDATEAYGARLTKSQ